MLEQSNMDYSSEGNTNNEFYDKIARLVAEAERYKREAYEESLRRERAEKDVTDKVHMCGIGYQRDELFSTAAATLDFDEGNETEQRINVTFVDKDGEETNIKVPVGMSMLEAAHENDLDLEGACEASLACSTCHAIVMDDASIICFLLHCQKFVELVRGGKLEDAILYGRREFHKFKISSDFDDLVKRVSYFHLLDVELALVAYDVDICGQNPQSMCPEKRCMKIATYDMAYLSC